MFESEAAAAEALASANAGGVPESEQAPAPVQESVTVEPGTTSHEDTLGQIDLSSIPEEYRPLIEETRKNLQGDYTRKTQEVAPYRKTLQEYGMSADDAREALGFVQALNDPTNLKALYERLSETFGQPTATGDTDIDLDGFGDQPDPRDRMLQDMQSRLESFERRQLHSEVSAELDRQEAVIRSHNPQWDDEDMKVAARFAIAHNGNLLKGAEDYKSFQQRVIGAHMKTKATVPAGATTGPGVSGHAEAPVKFKNLQEAHEAALKAYAADLAN